MAKYTLDDLPRFSGWPARLLGITQFDQRVKSPVEVMREYEREKWGPLLLRAASQKQPSSLAVINEYCFQDAPLSLCSVGPEFELLPALEAHQRHVALVSSALAMRLPARALVELGAGYGAVLLALAREQAFRGLPLFAGEYAPSGVELIERIARAEGFQIQAGACDFRAKDVTGLSIPHGSVIFTSMATPCVPDLPPSFVESLLALAPKCVVHIEPCYEHCDPNTLLGQMRRKYIEVNDYNRNLLTLLHEFEAAGRIKIVEERPHVFGANPLLAASVIAWTP